MKTARKFTYVFLCLLSVAIIFELVCGIAMKADKHWVENLFIGETCGNMNSTQCSSSVKDAEKFYDDHESQVFYVLLAAVAVQCFAGFFACCFKSTHADYDMLAEDDWDEYQAHTNTIS